MIGVTRRQFVQTAAIFSASSYARIIGANGSINVGFIGTGKMGLGNMRACKKQLNTRISWVCDVWDNHLLSAMKEAPLAQATKNFLEVLSSKNLDAVCISTPDHWHALMAVMAMERELHVYCEKPVAHCVEEVKIMMRAQHKYNRVFQSGQWQHSDDAFHQAIDWARSKTLGQLVRVNTYLYWQEPNIGNVADSLPPSSLGENGWRWWIGPAKYRPFNWVVFQSDPAVDPEHKEFARFRYFLDYGSGMLGDWGAHLLTPGIMGIQSPGPFSIFSVARLKDIEDMREAPNIWFVSAEFKDRENGQIIPVIFDHLGNKPPAAGKKREIDTEFSYASGARIRVNRISFELIDEADMTAKQVGHDSNRAIVEHWHDFIDHIRDNNLNTKTNLAKIAQSHIVILAALALYRVNPAERNGIFATAQMSWDPIKQKPLYKNGLGQIEKYLDCDYQNGWQMPRV